MVLRTRVAADAAMVILQVKPASAIAIRSVYSPGQSSSICARRVPASAEPK
jgi:hypothetical protein